MPPIKQTPHDSLKTLAAKQAELKAAASAEIDAIKRRLAERQASLNSQARRISAKFAKEQKRRENHAKIVLGVAMIQRCKESQDAMDAMQRFLEIFYADAPARLEAAKFGFTLTVMKPKSDADQL